MPWDQVMHKFKRGLLHSGGPGGPVVRNRKQAIAVMLSEKTKAAEGNEEYQSDSGKGKLKRALRGGG